MGFILLSPTKRRIFTIWFIRADNYDYSCAVIRSSDVVKTVENLDDITALFVHWPEKDNDSGVSCCLSVTGSDF